MAGREDWCALPECLRDSRHDRDRLVCQLAVRHAENTKAVCEEDLVAFAVALEGEPMPVGLPAVELDNEALLGPVEIGFVAVDRGIRERSRELGLSDQLE